MNKRNKLLKLDSMPLVDYIEYKLEVVRKAWKEGNGDHHEYLKGQFLVLRELLEPIYRRDTP